MSEKTFKIDVPPVKGDAVKAWQRSVLDRFSEMGIDYPLKADGVYGHATRSATADLLYALGIAREEMAGGVTPELRSKVRADRRTTAERARADGRIEWRRDLREKHDGGGVAMPVTRVITAAWGWHGRSGHDGIDVQAPADSPIFAMVRSRVIDVRAGGWWGKSPSGNVALGDGIIQLEVLQDVGPFKKGMHLGYGHSEHHTRHVGDVVDPGDVIGRVGLAVTWHVHLLANHGEVGTKGIGTFDPAPLLAYARKHG